MWMRFLSRCAAAEGAPGGLDSESMQRALQFLTADAAERALLERYIQAGPSDVQQSIGAVLAEALRAQESLRSLRANEAAG